MKWAHTVFPRFCGKGENVKFCQRVRKCMLVVFCFAGFGWFVFGCGFLLSWLHFNYVCVYIFVSCDHHSAPCRNMHVCMCVCVLVVYKKRVCRVCVMFCIVFCCCCISVCFVIFKHVMRVRMFWPVCLLWMGMGESCICSVCVCHFCLLLFIS